jgi:2-polyprenyl-3-methyl-5-hydroxy-6-metoxy-1,4-benzoquinol methylase/tetratricopeptide (TPR) repeat protein
MAITSASKENPNYSEVYDRYWASTDRIGEMSANLSMVAERLVLTCGITNVLDIGAGEGGLVAELLCRGVDAHGLDVSQTVVDRCNRRLPGRFTQGSVLQLPYGDESFSTVVSTDCLEHLAPEDIPGALAEIYRVTSRNVLLQIATTQDRDGHWHLTVEGRAWWEKRCLEAGFRKHPAYYQLNEYEALNRDGWQIYILVEKIPVHVREEYPLSLLEAERDLHMDMLRDVGERSDAHLIRYHWACNYIKPGDRVLDAACGLGYGGHVIRHLTKAAEVVGIDGSESSITYATAQYGSGDPRADYRCGMLPEILSSFEDGSFDVIVSFETLEHVENPEALIGEFNRLLTPGGRTLVSVPNDWSDESGRDPNPHHLRVYDWGRLKSELARHFLLEDAFAQTASRCKVAEKGNIWEPRPRSLHSVEWGELAPTDCEWWLMTAMKSPLEADMPYRERVFENLASTAHPSVRYAEYFVNPWIMHAMVNAEYRLKNSVALEKLATDVMATYPMTSNDYAAALCVRAYRVLQKHDQNLRKSIIDNIDQLIDVAPSNPMALRWRVSLLFVKAKLLEVSGDLIGAKELFGECSQIDVREFGVHLATKTTEAAYLAGALAYSLGDPSEARRYWQRCADIGRQLLSAKLADILINPDFPNLFNHGDGVREYAVAWDNIARCANGVHLLHFDNPIAYSALNNSHQTEYSGVTADLIATRQTLAERTVPMELLGKDLDERTEELVSIRRTLAERSELLAHTGQELQQRTAELVSNRETLVERSELLAHTSQELQQRTAELVANRETLVERSELLAHTSQELQQRTAELVATRETLVERSELLAQCNRDLQERTQDLVVTRQALADRTTMLEHSNRDLQERTQQLASYLALPFFKRIFIRRMK